MKNLYHKKKFIKKKYRIVLFFVLVFSLFVIHCKRDATITPTIIDEEELEAIDPILKLLSPNETGIDFANIILEDLENNSLTNINMYNGGGLAIIDINNDQLPDIYFICSNGKNKLYLNEGGLRFKDITDTALLSSDDGFETAATTVDINGDGWQDIYVCRAGVKKDDSRRNKLFINNKDLTFTERGKEYGLDDMSASTGANFFDFDLDGDLDLYLLNYPTDSIWTNKIEARLGTDGHYKPALNPRSEYDSDRFYRNDFNTTGKFTDISEAAGIWNLGYGLSVSVSDINRDGWPDVYVANDFIQPDRLYINNKKGGFDDHLDQYFKHTTQHTMGTDLADFDNDGLVDLVALDMLPKENYRQKSLVATNKQSSYQSMIEHGYFEPVVRNVLQHNNGNGTFSDIGCLAGISNTDWSWSSLLFDINNDGLKDAYISNGYRRDITNRDFIEFTLPEIKSKTNLQNVYKKFEDLQKVLPNSKKIRDFCFRNKGDLTFEDVNGKWLTSPATWSCGAAWSDLDNDGDLDLVVNNLEDPAFVYQNQTADKKNFNFLQIRLEGDGMNRFGIGATVSIEQEGKIQYAEMYTTRGIFSSVEPLIHFGLGMNTKIDKLSIRWPKGNTQVLNNITVNQKIILKERDANGSSVSNLYNVKSNNDSFFQEIEPLKYRHEENEFNDFDSWPLNPWKETEFGPSLSVGDVNGDGLDDVFIGNGFDKAPQLLIQDTKGEFNPSSNDTWNQTKIYEDHGSCFFDADMDGDLDLFVVSGGAEATSPAAWQNRLYINVDGKGKFIFAGKAIPQTPDVGGRVCSYDFDQDGDNDIFIGGRISPGKWPITPKSVILRNDRNIFTDVTSEVSPEFQTCGMVTDLQWINIDRDNLLELVVCGEWMPITIFKLVKNRLVNITTAYSLDSSNGIWNKLSSGDLDGDGDIDLVTGNLGLNTRLKASAMYPLRCIVNDFDKNNAIDPIMAMYEGDKLYPLIQKDVMVKQIPSLKKKILYSEVYAKSTVSDIFSQTAIDQSINLFCYELASCWWENNNGRFIRHELPILSQVSSVHGIIISDFNGDKKNDILLAGNKHGMEVETNACDAGNGALLLGNGNGGFYFVDNVVSGFWAQGEVRDLVLLNGKKNKTILIGNNNSTLEAFKVKQ